MFLDHGNPHMSITEPGKNQVTIYHLLVKQPSFCEHHSWQLLFLSILYAHVLLHYTLWVTLPSSQLPCITFSRTVTGADQHMNALPLLSWSLLFLPSSLLFADERTSACLSSLPAAASLSPCCFGSAHGQFSHKAERINSLSSLFSSSSLYTFHWSLWGKGDEATGSHRCTRFRAHKQTLNKWNTLHAEAAACRHAAHMRAEEKLRSSWRANTYVPTRRYIVYAGAPGKTRMLMNMQTGGNQNCIKTERGHETQGECPFHTTVFEIR